MYHLKKENIEKIAENEKQMSIYLARGYQLIDRKEEGQEDSITDGKSDRELTDKKSAPNKKTGGEQYGPTDKAKTIVGDQG